MSRSSSSLPVVGTPMLPEPRNEGPLSSSSVSFPSTFGDPLLSPLGDAESSSSMITSSDKLSALPFQSSPNLNRVRGTMRPVRRSLDAATSSVPALPSADSSPVTHAQRLFASPSGASESESSVGKETPKQRVSFDSDRISLPATLQSIRQVIATRHGAATRSDSAHGNPPSGSPVPQTRPTLQSTPQDGAQTPLSRSPSPSRAASPLRRFLHRAHSRDEPFVAVDPFQLRMQWFASPNSTPQRRPLELDLDCEDTLTTCLPLPISCAIPKQKLRTCGLIIHDFFFDTFPRQMYLHMLLRLPALYFARVARIFEDAEVSKHEIQRMIDVCAPERETDPTNVRPMSPPASQGGTGLGHRRWDGPLPYPEDWTPPTVTPALARFKNSWEQFVDSLMREWKTLNLVSALLCTTILTIFQVPDAAGDPLTRWAAIFSLVFALMSLIYGCMYIVQFGTMRSMYKASRWAEEARKSRTLIWWNVWVLLATPAIWLAWSMIAFVIAILSFVWRSGSSSDPEDGQRPALSPNQALAVRVVVTFVFGMGLLQFIMIIRTFSSYSGRPPRRTRRSDELGTSDERVADGERRPRERRESRKAHDVYEDRGREKGRESTDEGKPTTGLGLSGLSNSLNTFGSASAVLIEEAEESDKKGSGSMKNEENMHRYPNGGGKISPKL